MSKQKKARALTGIPKARSGIKGLDEITFGGLPAGRPTLICGGPGCGKTLISLEFLMRGAAEFDEPGIFVTFEERVDELTQNANSLGFNLDQLQAEGKLAFDHIRLERSEIEETGEYDLEGLFVRLQFAIQRIKAKRVVLDTIESLFSGLSNTAILRSELRRLFHWLKEQKLTALITAERGDGQLTRQGLEEYVSDCVILLDHRVFDQVTTRRLRIVKYRGSMHGTNEYPFLIHEHGINVLPITSMGLQHEASSERVSSGIELLDDMLGGKGYFKGSSILVSGTAGTGKSSLAAYFAEATARRGERSLYFAFEESASQIMRNMRSINLDLHPAVKKGLLHFHAVRPSLHGVEMHLAIMQQKIDEFQPATVVIDPLTNLIAAGSESDVQAMLLRLIDMLKVRGITALFTSLTRGEALREQTDVGVSSLMDTWLLLRDIESDAERNRGLHILKSRGMAHSNQVREFILDDKGIHVREVYLGAEGLLTGSARVIQESKERAAQLVRKQEIERKQRELERKRLALEAQIALLREQFEGEREELEKLLTNDELRERQIQVDLQDVARSRHVANRRPLTGGGKQGNGRG